MYLWAVPLNQKQLYRNSTLIIPNHLQRRRFFVNLFPFPNFTDELFLVFLSLFIKRKRVQIGL